MRSRQRRLLALLAVAALAFASPSDAQVLYGSIVGNVTDTTGAVVPGATVTIIQAETSLAREGVTSRDGNYSFANVQQGAYTVRVVLQGFKEHVEEGVPVSPNTVSRVDLALSIGAVTEVVTVQSERALLQTDSGDLHTVLEAEEIGKLPLGNYRNYQQLLNLVPGTTPARFQNAITDTPARGLSTNVNGTSRNNNNQRLDGATNVFIWLPHHAVYVAPSETVETVNVSTASFDAEQGFAGGAAVTVQTKSGTNEFHGSGTYLFENEGLRARNFFNPNEKPETDRKIGAVTLGGPIVKNKFFFFLGWEGHYTTSPTTRTGTVPTAAMRAGNFGSFGTTIFDPNTGNADGSGRTPFAGNVIPGNRIDPTALELQSRLPLPNTNLDGTSDNYTDTGLTNFDRNNYDVKLNWNVSQSALVWIKYSRMDATVQSDMWLGNPDEGGAGGSGWGVGSGTGDTKVQLGTIGATFVVSPIFVIDATLATSRFDQEVIAPDFGVNYGSDVLGIPGTNGEGAGGGDIRYSGLPSFGISDYTTFGGVDGWTPIFRDDDTYNFSANATWIKSNHEFRFGLDVNRYELNHWQPELGNPRGSFNFTGGATVQGPTGSADQFNSYAQFLLGLATDVNKSIQSELFTGREWYFGAYIRDRWRVNQDLTLNIGLRFENYPLMTRADRGIERYDDTTNQVILGGLGGNPEDAGITVKHQKILPRVGFNYRLNDDNILRGGYGITVSPMPFSRPLRGFYPLVPSNTFVGVNAFVPFGSLQTGVPLFPGPDISGGSVELPPTALMRSPGTAGSRDVTRGTIQSWNLVYERRLPWDASASVGYVGTKTKDGLGFLDFNAAAAGEGQDGQILFQRFGRTASTHRFDGFLDSNYHSLQVALNKPFSDGLFLKVAYTWSKAMNRADDTGWETVTWNHPSVFSKNYGPGGFDRTHIFQAGFVWEMPWAKDGEGALAATVKDWTLNGTFAAFTGSPFRTSADSASVNAPGNSQSADQVGTPTVLGGIGADAPYYDPSAWAPVTEVRFGNTGRNNVRGPGAWNLDLGLFRTFPVGEKVRLELRAEAFNVTNTPHFNNPNGDVSSSSFMTITGTNANSPERQFRVGARISF